MATSILGLQPQQVKLLAEELEALDPQIHNKFNHVKTSTGLPDDEVLEYIVLSSPTLWAKVYLDWTARDYQIPILEQGKNSKKLVLRLGRRLGKTECMCVLILWYAYTQINKGPNANQFDILIITPFETQIDLIFDRLHQLIDQSPIFQNSVVRDVFHRLELANGSKITGLTAGSKSGTGAANTRGQRADLIVLDECDYIGSSEITNIINIRNEAPDRIRIVAASTPSGKREEYYKWCTGASLKLHPVQEDIDNFRFTGYIPKKTRGNGWIEIYAPSVVNKEIIKINPDTDQTYIEDLKDELTDMRFKQEVLAEFGEEEMGVYQKKYLDWAIEEGNRVGHKYTTEYSDEELKAFLSKRRTGPIILGVDWDKFGASTNMVAVYLDNLHRDENGDISPMFKVLFRVEIPRGSFTYTNAVEKIVELNELYDFDWIAVDRGYGETQIELLHKYGISNPRTNLHEKVIGYQFSEKIEVRDPYTYKKDKKPLKPFMVNNSVMVFERNKMVFNPNDKRLVQQFEQYRIKNISSTGLPTYDDKNEHMVDAINLALLTFEQKYGDLLKKVITSKVAIIPKIDRREEAIKSRTDNKSNIVNLIALGNKNGYIKDATGNKAKRSQPMPMRRSF